MGSYGMFVLARQVEPHSLVLLRYTSRMAHLRIALGLGCLLAFSACSGDLVVDIDMGTQADTGSAGSPCEQFCAGEMAQCPTDTACLESCGHATIAPTQAAIDCATNATDCAAEGACWGMLGL